ncbi:response regulator [Anaeromyxobacter oryzisoli]|uniref:response regulator n=1 Tax=Anaeromyxobacter oryzisoli TaxID=2925408 RepID=UPI001F59DCAA|nr:response regulator [Anaeromyxobacter sp. SG63]
MDSEWLVVFGSAEGDRLRRVAELICSLPRLCEGELEECDAGYSPSGHVLLALLRFGPGAPGDAIRQRLAFWTQRELGRAVELEPGGLDDERRDALLGQCERTARALWPASVPMALAELVAGAVPAPELVGRRHPVMTVDLDASGEVAASEGQARELFVPSEWPLPVGDTVAMAFRASGAIRSCEARVTAAPEGGPDGASAGIVLELLTPSADLLALLALRLGSGMRRSPRYDVNLAVRVTEPGDRVRLEYATEAQFTTDYVENLSQGGAFVRTDRPRPAGASVQLELILPRGRALVLPAVVVHARAGGMGVRFELDPAREAALGAEISELAHAQRRALIVDDSVLARRLVADALGERGFSVTEASDGPAALRALEDQFDVVVADLIMPGMGGEDLLAEIRRRAPDEGPAVVLASGRLDDETRERLATLGADRVVDKSLGPEGIAREAAEATESGPG